MILLTGLVIHKYSSVRECFTVKMELRSSGYDDNDDKSVDYDNDEEKHEKYANLL